jgi:hypothetical protein
MEKYNMLTIIKEVDSLILPSGQKNKAFLCKCDCGTEKIVRKLHLVTGRIKSCGCLRRVDNLKSDDPIKKLYRTINYRVSENYFQKHLYFNKGIKMCDEWKNDRYSFYLWANNNGYSKGLQIDRIDSNGNYEPSNCRFVTPKQNCNNRENTFFVIYYGKKYAFTELIQINNLQKHEATIRNRIKRNWTIEKAFDTAIRKGNYRTSQIQKK